MDGVESAEAAADDADAVGVDLSPLLEPIEHRGCKPVEVRPQLGLEIHLALPRSVERAGREPARETQILEAVALLLGALQSAEHDRDRHATGRRGRQPQIARDNEAFERQVETDRRRREQWRGLTIERDLAHLPLVAP